jgi:hypothetical protein
MNAVKYVWSCKYLSFQRLITKETKYEYNYLQFGFIFVDHSTVPDTQCILCFQT